MRAGKRRLRHVQWTMHRSSEDLRRHTVPRENRRKLAHGDHAVLVDVIEATDERTDEARAGLRREKALVRAKHEGAVRRDAVLC